MLFTEKIYCMHNILNQHLILCAFKSNLALLSVYEAFELQLEHAGATHYPG